MNQKLSARAIHAVPSFRYSIRTRLEYYGKISTPGRTVGHIRPHRARRRSRAGNWHATDAPARLIAAQ
jgi:hypothetical protein